MNIKVKLQPKFDKRICLNNCYWNFHFSAWKIAFNSKNSAFLIIIDCAWYQIYLSNCANYTSNLMLNIWKINQVTENSNFTNTLPLCYWIKFSEFQHKFQCFISIIRYINSIACAISFNYVSEDKFFKK